MHQVLVLNASYEPLNVCTVRRAYVLVGKGRAEVIERHDEPMRTSTAAYPRPHVIRLTSYVRVPQAVKRRISRRALFARDGWRCVYCGSGGGRLTLDHVVPRSRGGASVWENVVTACAPCNLRKGNRLLEEARMTLPRPPRAPAPVLFIRISARHVPDTWRTYLTPFESEPVQPAAA
ncbi:MAG: HNH endonuclease [Gaiella sp.]